MQLSQSLMEASKAYFYEALLPRLPFFYLVKKLLSLCLNVLSVFHFFAIFFLYSSLMLGFNLLQCGDC